MTDPGSEHARYDELAAGYALHALEPDDELRFLRHAGQCQACAQAIADYAEVAAALAGTAPAAEPSPQLEGRIMAAVTDDLSGGAQVPGKISVIGGADRDAPASPHSIRRRPAQWLKLSAAAAAVVLVAGGGIWGGLAATGGNAQQPPAGCAQARQCTEVRLTDAAHQTDATVIISGGSIWLLPSRLPADDAARQVYVLWQITGDHTPLAVGSFDVRGGAHSPIRIGALAAPYHDTWAFAVSLEHGRTIPATPSRPVTIGQIPA